MLIAHSYTVQRSKTTAPVCCTCGVLRVASVRQATAAVAATNPSSTGMGWRARSASPVMMPQRVAASWSTGRVAHPMSCFFSKTSYERCGFSMGCGAAIAGEPDLYITTLPGAWAGARCPRWCGSGPGTGRRVAPWLRRCPMGRRGVSPRHTGRRACTPRAVTRPSSARSHPRGPATHGTLWHHTLVPRKPSHNERHRARSVRGLRYAPRRLA